MAKYKLHAPFFDSHHVVHPEGAVLTLPDAHIPARGWLPMDRAAQEALQRVAQADLEKLTKEAREKLEPEEVERRLALVPLFDPTQPNAEEEAPVVHEMPDEDEEDDELPADRPMTLREAGGDAPKKAKGAKPKKARASDKSPV